MAPKHDADDGDFVPQVIDGDLEFDHPNSIFDFVRDTAEFRCDDDIVRRVQDQNLIGTLAAAMAHEINNPLAAACTSAHVASSIEIPGEAGKMMRECMDNLEKSLHRCHQVVQNVLRLARHETLEKSPQDVNDIIRIAHNSMYSYAEQTGVTLVLDLTEGVTAADVNAAAIEQVAINLISNAVNASNRGSEVTLRTRQVDNALRIVVEDQGIGLTQEQRSQIFHPFCRFRRSVQGRGIGLSVVQHIIKDHGGTIDVASFPGAGTIFIVELPLFTGVPHNNCQRHFHATFAATEPTTDGYPKSGRIV